MSKEISSLTKKLLESEQKALIEKERIVKMTASEIEKNLPNLLKKEFRTITKPFKEEVQETKWSILLIQASVIIGILAVGSMILLYQKNQIPKVRIDTMNGVRYQVITKEQLINSQVSPDKNLYFIPIQEN
ncbi:hypothetical protein R77591_02511 [Ralstonia mannitolilytica]|uniref:Uncharacterized protein n=2 Tax=Burkholderiaceae TaxID=119060 RepID=A0A6P2KGI9_9BURK|nr:hypothetical protein R77591_02511 [Ralstonia mannitolilytica]VWB55636.1 hypothetical protein BPS26883_02595 [Burkholderia pseudomultivorans]